MATFCSILGMREFCSHKNSEPLRRNRTYVHTPSQSVCTYVLYVYAVIMCCTFVHTYICSRSYVRTQRQTVKHFLEHGTFLSDKRELPSDQSLMPVELLRRVYPDKRLPHDLDALQTGPKLNPRPRIIDRSKKKTKRDKYWGKAARDVRYSQGSQGRSALMMRVYECVKSGKSPSELFKKHSGDWWRAKNLARNMC